MHRQNSGDNCADVADFRPGCCGYTRSKAQITWLLLADSFQILLMRPHKEMTCFRGFIVFTAAVAHFGHDFIAW